MSLATVIAQLRRRRTNTYVTIGMLDRLLFSQRLSRRETIGLDHVNNSLTGINAKLQSSWKMAIARGPHAHAGNLRQTRPTGTDTTMTDMTDDDLTYEVSLAKAAEWQRKAGEAKNPVLKSALDAVADDYMRLAAEIRTRQGAGSRH
jgi:1-aminocyclopropane-1-carboxylate deaminase/D-cysteine desulfhydrase-like pyridoxal-dependent ACC family enzyme